ncbi:MAG TPA: DUF4369 domain-containing protein [Sphingobacterium sp.]|nr:DUF4369 domain-containing protein [Sphingobacterium sp.]
MHKYLLLLFTIGWLLTGCRQTGQQSGTAQDTVYVLHSIKILLSGTAALPDRTKVYINTDENTMQPLLSGYVNGGAFVIEGELAEPNFYNLVVQQEVFKVYLENGATYAFTGTVDSDGRLQSGRITSSSPVMNDYLRYEKLLESKNEDFRRRSAALQREMDNPKTYQAAVEKSLLLGEERSGYREKLKQEFLEDGKVGPAFKLFLIKEDNIRRENYSYYDDMLKRVPDSLKEISLYRQVAWKVTAVRQFYEDMPDFPAISPRNPAGDSLKLEAFKDRGTLLLVFWGAWNGASKDDIIMIRRKADALSQMHIMPVYLTWDKNYDSWTKASDALRLGEFNYRLNATDQDFIATNYGVRTLPHYMLVKAADRTVIDHDFKFPLDGKLEQALKGYLSRSN